MLAAWIESSPFASSIGLIAESIEKDAVVVRLPFRPSLVTQGEVVHRGAIGALMTRQWRWSA